MRIDFTITMPGLLELKNMFDLSKELDVQILTKVMFTFSDDEIFSPLAVPKQILNEIIDEALDYIKPKCNWKQQSMVNVLENLKNRTNIFPTKKGKDRQLQIDKIRNKSITNILSKDQRLLDWWNSV